MVQLHYTNTIQMIQNLFQTIYLTRILDTFNRKWRSFKLRKTQSGIKEVLGPNRI